MCEIVVGYCDTNREMSQNGRHFEVLCGMAELVITVIIESIAKLGCDNAVSDLLQIPGRVAGPGKRLSPAEVRFDLREAELNWVELWAIWGEVYQSDTGLLAESGDFAAVMDACVVHH
jgi:hypothetical protein